MTPDEARALFDDAFDGELDDVTQRAFDAALANDASLRDEYTRYERALREARSALAGDVPPVDLLAGVQEKLRARSGGRFYKDRFAEARGRTPAITWLLALSTIVVLAVALWLAIDAFGGGVQR